ncbi:MAG TPA: hypothetical protein VE912_24695 [Bacteroidales bacterium]|nr:hypothetical protein [Bacteroidales bacterium]
MDTDDLSTEVYAAIIAEAEKLSHDLTLQFGVLSYDCENEGEFLKKSRQLAKEIKGCDEYELEDLLFGNVPEMEQLMDTLNQIISNIEEVKKIPPKKRHYDF